MYGETVEVLRATVTEDRYGNAEASWSDDAALTLEGCAVAPTSSDETNDGRTAVVTGVTVYAPGVDRPAIYRSDRLRIRGDIYEIVGDVADWRNPYEPARGGLEIRARRADG